jgi:hypothetical protein
MGIKDMRVIFVFHDEKVMRQFVEQGWQFGGKADVSAKHGDTGVSAEQAVKANVDFKEGTVAAGSSTDARAGTQKSGQDGRRRDGRRDGDFPVHRKRCLASATVAGTKYWKDWS